MGLQENKALVTRFWEKWSAGSADDVMALMTEDSTAGPMARSTNVKATREELAMVVKALSARTRLMGMTVTGMTAEGDRVAVEVEGHYTFTDGKEYNNLYHLLFVIRDGRIASIREYADTLYVSQVFPKGFLVD